jgi:hypothetical protein
MQRHYPHGRNTRNLRLKAFITRTFLRQRKRAPRGSPTAEIQEERTDNVFHPRTPVTNISAPEKKTFQLQGKYQAYYRAAQSAIAAQQQRYIHSMVW